MKSTEKLIQEKVKTLEEENADLKRRINNVIKYIRSNEWAKDYENSNCRTHLLQILQGKDNE